MLNFCGDIHKIFVNVLQFCPQIAFHANCLLFGNMTDNYIKAKGKTSVVKWNKNINFIIVMHVHGCYFTFFLPDLIL